MSSPSDPEVRVLPTDEVPRAAAERIAAVLAEAVAARGIAHWATTGGSAAPGIYTALATPPLRDRVPWGAVHTWFGDDRYVPYDHPESNVRPLVTILLGATTGDLATRGTEDPRDPDARQGIPMAHQLVHRWPVGQAIAEGTGPASAAAGYTAELQSLVPADSEGTPVLDLIVLGVGPDGHILSVFPGSPAWDASAPCVAVPAPTHLEPHIERVTFHPRLVAAARHVVVLTTGAAKAASLGRAWTGDDARELPVRAARIPTATWILDEAAAAELPRA